MEVQYKSLSHDVVVPLVTVGHFDNPQIGKRQNLAMSFLEFELTSIATFTTAHKV
jgi:hypothetical protein